MTHPIFSMINNKALMQLITIIVESTSTCFEQNEVTTILKALNTCMLVIVTSHTNSTQLRDILQELKENYDSQKECGDLIINIQLACSKQKNLG